MENIEFTKTDEDQYTFCEPTNLCEPELAGGAIKTLLAEFGYEANDEFNGGPFTVLGGYDGMTPLRVFCKKIDDRRLSFEYHYSSQESDYFIEGKLSIFSVLGEKRENFSPNCTASFGCIHLVEDLRSIPEFENRLLKAISVLRDPLSP